MSDDTLVFHFGSSTGDKVGAGKIKLNNLTGDTAHTFRKSWERDKGRHMRHTNKNIDPEKTHLNVDYVFDHETGEMVEAEHWSDIRAAVDYRLSQRDTTPTLVVRHMHDGTVRKSYRKEQKNVVAMREFVFGISPTWYEKHPSPEDKQRSVKDMTECVQHFFGKENIVAVSWHNDEGWFHAHVYTVVLDKDGRLRQKSFFGHNGIGNTEMAEKVDDMRRFLNARGYDLTMERKQNQVTKSGPEYTKLKKREKALDKREKEQNQRQKRLDAQYERQEANRRDMAENVHALMDQKKRQEEQAEKLAEREQVVKLAEQRQQAQAEQLNKQDSKLAQKATELTHREARIQETESRVRNLVSSFRGTLTRFMQHFILGAKKSVRNQNGKLAKAFETIYETVSNPKNGEWLVSHTESAFNAVDEELEQEQRDVEKLQEQQEQERLEKVRQGKVEFMTADERERYAKKQLAYFEALDEQNSASETDYSLRSENSDQYGG